MAKFKVGDQVLWRKFKIIFGSDKLGFNTIEPYCKVIKDKVVVLYLDMISGEQMYKLESGKHIPETGLYPYNEKGVIENE